MPLLPLLPCPYCGRTIAGVDVIDKVVSAKQFRDCHRRCESCGVGVSNTSVSHAATYIHRDPLNNIPAECRHGAIETLRAALNVRNRESKRQRFGFSTSEDAVTWVVFTYLYRSRQLLQALGRIGLHLRTDVAESPSLLLWGVPIGQLERDERATKNRRALEDICASLGEAPNSFSEPDVIIDCGEQGLVFIEVKHRSGNDTKPADYRGWSTYFLDAPLAWDVESVRQSGHYELARNWRLLNALAPERPVALVNLGPKKLFIGASGQELDRFIDSLGTDDRHQVVKATWPEFLGDECDRPSWFVQFCRDRGLSRTN